MLLAIVEQAPPGSAISRVGLNQRAQDWIAHPDILALLRRIEYNTAMLVWSKTEDAAKKQYSTAPKMYSPPPELLPKPKPQMTLDPTDPNAEEHVIGGTGVEREQMAQMLGWTPPPPDAAR